MQEANLLAKIKDGEVDLGLMLDRTTADSILERTIVRDEPLVLIAPIHHPLAQMDTVTLHDLNNCELIVSEESCIYRSLFENLLKEHGIIFRIGFELSNLEAIKRCVMNGLGIALLPKIVAEEEIERGSLAELSFIHPEIHFDLQLLMHLRSGNHNRCNFNPNVACKSLIYSHQDLSQQTNAHLEFQLLALHREPSHN